LGISSLSLLLAKDNWITAPYFYFILQTLFNKRKGLMNQAPTSASAKLVNFDLVKRPRFTD